MDLTAPAPTFQRAQTRRDASTDRLVAAAADQLANRGRAATSARSLALAAGAAPSAINYNFGGIEHLFCSAFEHGAALTVPWIEGRSAEIAVLPQHPASAALALEHVITAWTGDQRLLALLYQEALAGAAGEGPVAEWTRLWRDFWLTTARSLGLGETEGRLMHLFFESEALYHLLAWSPALERAALREMCGHFAAVYLGAAPQPPTGALDTAERVAGVVPEGVLAPAALKIVEAAADVVEEGGLGGLTHRAVAARAGMTTGAVTHHFRTMEDLVAGTIRGQVRAMEHGEASRPLSAVVDKIRSAEAFFDGMRDYVVTDRPWGPALRRRHLFLAATRRPDLAGSAAVIRFAHGSTTSGVLARFFAVPGDQRSLYSGVLSRLAVASWFACSADPGPRQMQDALVAEIRARLTRDLPAA